MNNPTENKSWRVLLMRVLICFLMALCSLWFAWCVYRWSQGKDEIFSVIRSLGLIFFSASMLIGKRNTALYYALISATLLCMFGSYLTL